MDYTTQAIEGLDTLLLPLPPGSELQPMPWNTPDTAQVHQEYMLLDADTGRSLRHAQRWVNPPQITWQQPVAS